MTLVPHSYTGRHLRDLTGLLTGYEGVSTSNVFRIVPLIMRKLSKQVSVGRNETGVTVT